MPWLLSPYVSSAYGTQVMLCNLPSPFRSFHMPSIAFSAWFIHTVQDTSLTHRPPVWLLMYPQHLAVADNRAAVDPGLLLSQASVLRQERVLAVHLQEVSRQTASERVLMITVRNAYSPCTCRGTRGARSHGDVHM
jgi:hypothetical protein